MLAPTTTYAEQLRRSREDLWTLLRDHLAAYAARRPVRTVCVVANAPLQTSAERAAEIDAADLVIRTNSVTLDEVDGQACVGRVCHVVVLSMATVVTRWVFQDYRSRAYLVPQAGWDVHPTAGLRTDLRLSAPFWPADLGAMPLPNALVKARLLRLLDADRPSASLLPTTGLMALYLGHELFGDAELIGTGFSFLHDEDQQSWSHHSGSHTRVHPHHDLALEARLLRSWIDDGTLRLLS